MLSEFQKRKLTLRFYTVDTSRIHFNNYEALGVGGQYVQVNESYHFPGFSLIDAIPEYLERSKMEGKIKQ